MSRKRASVAAILTLVGGMSAGIASADPPAPPQPKTTMDHAGTYVVGTDIVPGTYSSAGPASGGTCYWKRLGSQGGNDIIDNAMSSKPQVVQIEPTDKAFKTDGCQPWQMTDPAGGDGTGGPAPPAQLHNDIDTLNGYGHQLGAAPLPPP